MNTIKITPVILSGGGGTRLWPLSTPDSPKQFLRLFGDKSLFQNTILRCNDGNNFDVPMVVGNAKHSRITGNQLSEIGINGAKLILEPAARNTAPAIALAALCCDENALMLVMPSDHLVGKEDVFLDAIERAKSAAQDGYLITFGITPTKAETGYGYIKCGDALDGYDGAHNVPKFTEKPEISVAQTMIDDGNYLWNAGIFLFRADAYLDALSKHAPDILAAAQQSLRGIDNDEMIHPDQSAFEASPSDSIDYAVMEKADKVAVIPVAPDWSDVGSWDSIAQLHEAQNEADNISIGKSKTIDAKGNMIWAGDMEVQMIGVDNLIVVAHEGKIVILPRGRSQDVKKLSE